MECLRCARYCARLRKHLDTCTGLGALPSPSTYKLGGSGNVLFMLMEPQFLPMKNGRIAIIADAHRAAVRTESNVGSSGHRGCSTGCPSGPALPLLSLKQESITVPGRMQMGHNGWDVFWPTPSQT